MKATIKLSDGTTVEKADVTKLGILAIHKREKPGKGFVLTHLPTGRLVLWSRLKRGLALARKELEGLNWTNPEIHRGRIEELRKELMDV
jgi:hypothetical protein